MPSLNSDRRRSEQPPAFPLTDSNGHQIVFERRSGNDRRANRRKVDVANNILRILN